MKQIIEKKLAIPPDYQYKAIRSANFFQASWHKNKLTVIDELLRTNRAMSVLDLGTGSGNFELEFAKRVKKIVGVDYNDEALGFLKEQLKIQKIKNVDLIYSDIRNITQKLKGAFDAIVITDTIEHIPTDDARIVIRKLKHTLAPGGRAYVITPNYTSLWYVIELILDRYTIVPKLHGQQHLAKYSKTSLNDLFIQEGYTHVYSGSFNLVSYLTPYDGLNKLLCRIELQSPLPIGNLLVGIYSNSGK